MCIVCRLLKQMWAPLSPMSSASWEHQGAVFHRTGCGQFSAWRLPSCLSSDRRASVSFSVQWSRRCWSYRDVVRMERNGAGGVLSQRSTWRPSGTREIVPVCCRVPSPGPLRYLAADLRVPAPACQGWQIVPRCGQSIHHQPPPSSSLSRGWMRPGVPAPWHLWQDSRLVCLSRAPRAPPVGLPRGTGDRCGNTVLLPPSLPCHPLHSSTLPPQASVCFWGSPATFDAGSRGVGPWTPSADSALEWPRGRSDCV